MRSYSYSMLSKAYQCNKLYKYLFIDKLSPKDPPGIELEFGTAIHAGIQECLETKDGSYDTFIALWDAFIERSEGRYSTPVLEQHKECGITLLQRFNRLHRSRFKVTAMEQRLYTQSPQGIRLEGTPDFIGTIDGVPSIVDFKTAGYPYPVDKIRTSDQLMLYAYMANKELGFKAKQIVYFVLVKGTKPSIQTALKLNIDLDSAEFMDRISNIENQCFELETKEVFTQNFNNCFFGKNKCSMWDKCHGGSK